MRKMKFDDRKVVELNLDDILPNRFQPRITFGEEAINELAESIKEHGVIQPIVVRKINDKYEIIAGERRYKASGMAGKTTIPAIVTDLNDKESAEIALIENVQREDLTPIEEAVSYKKILDMGYLTQEDLSSKLGKKQSTISNKLRLLNLDEEVQEALLEKKISERHARSLLRLESKEQRSMLNRIITERLTVRKTDAEIDKMLQPTQSSEVKVESQSNVDVLEILDVDDLDSKGEIKMNNNEMNNNSSMMNSGINSNFNIPTMPIIEEQPSTTSAPQNQVFETQFSPVENITTEQGSGMDFKIPNTSIVEDMPLGGTPIEAPGFMDVDKIANTATDINVEKPTANLDSLLQPAPKILEKSNSKAEVNPSIFGFAPSEPTSLEKEATISVDQDSNLLKPGKFFDLGNIQDETTDSTNSSNSPAETIPSIAPTVETISEPAIQSSNNNSMAQSSMDSQANKSSMFGINLEPKNPSFISNVEEKEANMDFGIPKPPVANQNLNFDNFFQTNEVEQPKTVGSEINQEVKEQPSVMNVGSDLGNITDSSTTMSNFQPIANESNNSNIEAPSYHIPSNDELDSFLNNLDSTTPLSSAMPEMTASSNSVIKETPQSSEPTVNVALKMDQVVAIIHEAKDKIAALGIQVELDEFDFDDMYQAIIKIDK